MNLGIPALDKRYRAKHPDRIRARSAVYVAVRSGALVRQPCERCGTAQTQAHHDSYLPEHRLNVQWLCSLCHRMHHILKRKLAKLRDLG